MKKDRYEIIGWDGCGFWKICPGKKRKFARNVKRLYQRLILPDTEIKHRYIKVKIYDRKLKKFIY